MNSTREHAAWAFGQALRTRRRELGMSQERLAELGDFDRTYPSLLERGLRTPTFHVILQLSLSLRTDPRVLFAEALAKYCETLPGSGRRIFHTLTELSPGTLLTHQQDAVLSRRPESALPIAARGISDKEAVWAMNTTEAASVLDTLINGLNPDSDQNFPLGAVLHRDTVIRALLAGKAAIETMNARQGDVVNLEGAARDAYKTAAL
jgi:transcriptional regulator with XRE-family HTH domain